MGEVLEYYPQPLGTRPAPAIMARPSRPSPPHTTLTSVKVRATTTHGLRWRRFTSHCELATIHLCLCNHYGGGRLCQYRGNGRAAGSVLLEDSALLLPACLPQP